MTSSDLERLAVAATTCLVRRERLEMTHAPGWQRPEGWPLPAVKGEMRPDGARINQYRPLAILEYVEYALTRGTKEEPLW